MMVYSRCFSSPKFSARSHAYSIFASSPRPHVDSHQAAIYTERCDCTTSGFPCFNILVPVEWDGPVCSTITGEKDLLKTVPENIAPWDDACDATMGHEFFPNLVWDGGNMLGSEAGVLGFEVFISKETNTDPFATSMERFFQIPSLTSKRQHLQAVEVQVTSQILIPMESNGPLVS